MRRLNNQLKFGMLIPYWIQVTIGLVAGWEDFDTTFLDDNLNNAG